ncbi:MAG TPA: sulfotransferase [Candidatus Limnocylindrales bacterium]|nr:sulfotransferase [Candidatus Limnocylindrales bacterium]
MIPVPNLFIIGAPKSGTTSLYEYLKGHPEIFMSVVKEPCYFARDLALDDSGNFLVYERDKDLYFDLFKEAGDAKRLGEGSTRYLYSKEAPALINEASPDARIIAMVRNPIDMAHSLHAHKLAAGTEDLDQFEDALAAEADRDDGKRIPAHSNPLLSTYRDRARFGEQLPRWFDAIGRDRVHVIVLEDMIRDPEEEFRRVLEFVGVDPTWRPESFAAHNTAHSARSRSIRRVLNGRIPQWFVWGLMPKVIGDTRTRGMVRNFRHSWFHRKPITKDPLSPELRRQLEDEFMPDVKRLSELLGRDLGELWFKRPALSGSSPAPASKETVTAS